MKVQALLQEMEERALDDTFMNDMGGIYKAAAQAGEYGDIENDYGIGSSVVRKMMPEQMLKAYDEYESKCSERCTNAATYGFKCGIFGAFAQYFGALNDRDGGFQTLVVEDLLMQPKMQRHVMNYTLIQECNQIAQQIQDCLDDVSIKHLTSVECSWQQRIYSCALQGFYFGYRAAFNIIELIKPLAKIEQIDKILTMEYYLGLIKPYSAVEERYPWAAA